MCFIISYRQDYDLNHFSTEVMSWAKCNSSTYFVAIKTNFKFLESYENCLDFKQLQDQNF